MIEVKPRGEYYLLIERLRVKVLQAPHLSLLLATLRARRTPEVEASLKSVETVPSNLIILIRTEAGHEVSSKGSHSTLLTT
jgi:hypothetical protein